MNEPTAQHETAEALLDRIVTDYLKRCERGETPDRQAILAGHPDLAGRLQEFFGDQHTIEQRTAGLRQLYASLGKETPADAWPSMDDYQIDKEIARGGMGVVYRARQVSLNRVVALKMVLAGEFASQQAKERFQAEAEAAAGLEHPNIVPIYQVGSHRGQPFLTMKLIDGPSLSQAIAGLPDQPREVARLMARTARAVHFAHQHGIFHRDLKPGNILLDRDGVPHVTDFGLAKKMESDRGLTQTGAIVGTPSYIAPEQARAEKQLTTAADVYALGAILYECLTGQPPHHGETPMDTLYQVMNEQPIAPRRIRARIDRNLETICLKCLEKEPARRYGSAEAVAEDLERYLAGEPIQARPVGAAVRTWSWTKRRPAVAALLAVSAFAVLALMGSVVGLAYSSRLHDALQGALQAREGEAEARKQAEMFKYFHHVGQAEMEWRRNNRGRMESLLDDCPADWRNWEWHYLNRLNLASLLTINAHQEAVLGVAYSPDGTRFVSAGADKTVKVWDAAMGDVVFTLRGHTDKVFGVAISPDGLTIASASADHTVRLWDAGTGQERNILFGSEAVLSVAFSPDGQHLAFAGADKSVHVWNNRTGRESMILKGHKDAIRSVAFSPDGKQLVSASTDKTCRVWDLTNGQMLFDWYVGPASNVVFLPDGQQLIAARDDRVTLKAAKPIGNLVSHPQPFVSCVAFSPDGTWIASGTSEGILQIKDSESFVRGEADIGIVVQPHGAEFILNRGKERSSQGHKGSINCLAFSPDGARVLSASTDGMIKVWNANEDLGPLTLRGHTQGVLSLSFSPDGKQIASASRDQTVRIWDVTTGQESLAIKGHKDIVYAVTFSPDGMRVASASADKTVCLWNAATGKVLRTNGDHKGTVFSVAFSRDGARLASASADKTVRICDATTGNPLGFLEGHSHSVNSVAFSPDDRYLVTASSDQTAKVWDAATGKALLTFEGHLRPLHCAAFSPDGKRIASGNPVSIDLVDPTGKAIGYAREPGKVIIWDASTGKEIHTLRGHRGPVNSVAFSPDGTRLASASDDRTVRIWDMTTGESLLTLQGHTGAVNSVAFSPDGARLASASEDGTIRIWDARPLTPDVAVERESVALLDFLFSKPLCKTDVIEYLTTSRALRPQVRQTAVALTKHYREPTDPEIYSRASRAVSRHAYLNDFQYRFALRQAETACRLAPGEGKHLTALGVAQYRLRQYQNALATLTRADQLNKDSVVDLAFTAMTQRRFGLTEALQTTVKRLKAIRQREERAASTDAWREAEAMIPGLAAR